MMDLQFSIHGAVPMMFAASPHVAFKLGVKNGGPEHIHSILLKCQLQIEVSRRSYSDGEQSAFVELFGQTADGIQIQRSLFWTHTQLVIPSFRSEIVEELHAPCPYDFNIAITKYFSGIQDGDVPVAIYFSGTVFYEGPDNTLQVAPISWDKEAAFRMPIRVWRELRDAYYPGAAWLCLHRDAFERLYAYKRRRGLTTFEEAVTRAIAAAEGAQ